MSTNTQLSALFDRMAGVLELLAANRFKVIAYQKASRVLEDLSTDVSEIADVGSLTKIDGIGKGLAEKIVEYIETGQVAEVNDALQQIPPGVVSLLDIPGLGPKSIATLWKEGGVETVEQLKEKIASGELEGLPRMGKKTLEKIAKSIAFAESSGDRIRIGDALPIAEYFVEKMRKIAGVVRADFAGSLKRGRETIGDIDILVSCNDPKEQAQAIGEAFRAIDDVEEILAAGTTKSSVRIKRGVQVDLRVVRDDQYGAALMYFTGSKAHNVALRERAIKKKMRLNEYALWDANDDSIAIASESEQDIYKALDLTWIAPEMREDRGELAVAETGSLPDLIKLSDIKAELHAHTTASDGALSIAQLAAEAKSRGFHTLAITDHSVSQQIANGLDAKRLEKHIAAIHETNENTKGITILAGSEVDILADGRLDYPDSLLAELDVVVASPHMSLSQDSKKATARILKAIENRYVHIIGHPTGRLILRREGLSPNMNDLIKAAAETGTALEINANHYRLDLRDTHARAAIEAGVMLAIDTDAHSAIDFDQLRHGILTARRAWVEPKHVVNCLTAAKLHKWLNIKRSG